MNASSSSNIELHSYVKAPQSDAESGVRQDNRSCGTKVVKWILTHPFLSAFAALGVVGAASGGIYGLTLLSTAAPLATALSGRNVALSDTVASNVTVLPGRNVTTNTTTTGATTTEATTTEATTTEATTTEATTTKAPTTKAPTTKAPTTKAPTTKATTTEATTTKAPTTEAPTTEATTTKAPTTEATTTEAPTTPTRLIRAVSVTCSGNHQVNPMCCRADRNHPSPHWGSYDENGMSESSYVGWQCYDPEHKSKANECTNKSPLVIDKTIRHDSMYTFCHSKKWGTAHFTEVPTRIVRGVTCSGNSQVNPICCKQIKPVWASWSNGQTGGPGPGGLVCGLKITPAGLLEKNRSNKCTNKSPLVIDHVIRHTSMDDFCDSKGWGLADYR